LQRLLIRLTDEKTTQSLIERLAKRGLSDGEIAGSESPAPAQPSRDERARGILPIGTAVRIKVIVNLAVNAMKAMSLASGDARRLEICIITDIQIPGSQRNPT
jgi:hypothetical protein